jgi:hypothetical protein
MTLSTAQTAARNVVVTTNEGEPLVYLNARVIGLHEGWYCVEKTLIVSEDGKRSSGAQHFIKADGVTGIYTEWATEGDDLSDFDPTESDLALNLYDAYLLSDPTGQVPVNA